MAEPTKAYRYEEARMLLNNILGDVAILAGEEVGPSNASWQDVAGTLACNLHVLAVRIEAARAGRIAHGRPFVFPSVRP